MRVFLVVLDSVGIGSQPDSGRFGDAGADTLGHVLAATGTDLPELGRLGLYNIGGTALHAPRKAEGCFGRMMELSQGKDTTTGHWEMVGIRLERPFPTYPDGFPAEVIDEFTRRTGLPVLGNCAASGTEIITRLGAEHLRTGWPIVYTSADSVFQIAAHEDVIAPERLYELCRTARGMLTGPHGVGRVIARPFSGVEGRFRRTDRRRDFSLEPPEGNLLDLLAAHGVPVVAIGKIQDIFAGRSITRWLPTHGNREGLEAVLSCMRAGEPGFCFANLVDFDMLYGHRNDVEGYAAALREVDAFLPTLRAAMGPEDILILTADHGCDPCHPGTDHTREYVPVLFWGQSLRQGIDLGTREGFGDLGQTVAELYGLPAAYGRSIKPDITKEEPQ